MGKKSAVHTAIDLQITKMERLRDEEIESFDRRIIIRTIHPLYFFKEKKGSFSTATRIEEQVFADAGTESVIKAMNRRNYILPKIKDE